MEKVQKIEEAGVTAVDALVELGRKLEMLSGVPLQTVKRPTDPNQRHYALVPDGYKIMDMQHLIHPPKEVSGCFDEVFSFLDFVNYFKDSRTRLYCKESDGTFLAVIDAVEPDSIDERICLGKQRGKLKLEHTPEAREWLANMGQSLSQADFAEFLEDYVYCVIVPDAADMLEVALTLQAKKEVEFKSGLRLNNGGIELQYTEQVKGTAGGAGKLEIPTDFVVRFPLYEGAGPIELKGKLRYRVNSGGVVFSYKFPQLETARRAYVRAIRELIAEETDLPVWSVSTL